MNRSFKKVWGSPLLLAGLTLFGLLAALLGKDIWWLISWVALLVPLSVILWYVYKPKNGHWVIHKK
jgi:hypothetical protein